MRGLDPKSLIFIEQQNYRKTSTKVIEKLLGGA